jgi:uncharacterized membrane protein required for colicin V production
MNAGQKLPVNWFDLLLLVVLVVGVVRGRKRGMSHEFMDLIQWLVIICGGAFLYQPVGQMFAQMTSSSMLFSYIFVYLGIAVIVKLFFLMIKHSVGDKLIGSDVFGSGEYYLGMGAGLVRFTCVLILALAVLHARQFTAAEIAAQDKFNKDVYGSDFFPSWHAIQVDVFENSFSGKIVKQQLSFLLITPTGGGGQPEKFKQKEFVPI